MSSFLRNLHHGDNASAELIVWSLPKQKQRERGSTLFPSNAGSIQFEIGWLRNWEKLLAEILFVLTLRQLRPSCPEHFDQSRLKIQNPFTFRTSYWGSSKASWASWENRWKHIFFHIWDIRLFAQYSLSWGWTLVGHIETTRADYVWLCFKMFVCWMLSMLVGHLRKTRFVGGCCSPTHFVLHFLSEAENLSRSKEAVGGSVALLDNLSNE